MQGELLRLALALLAGTAHAAPGSQKGALGSDEGQLAMTQDHALGSVDRQAAGPAPGVSGRASGVLPRVVCLRRVQRALQKVLGASGFRRVDAHAQPWRDDLKQGSTRVRMEVE
ncbi:hypothetical protein [Stenotrophomonas indicatrix]|uniref:hypothetical protein n=1 Tax=Stenotrophomonas indicatrix TaxID=2045451 RepID=UPI002FD99783